MAGILLWVPSGSIAPRGWGCVTSYVAMKTPGNVGFTFTTTPADSVETTWNSAVRGFLETDLEWMLSCHDDIVFAPDSLVRLMSREKKLVSALVFQRNPPCFPFVFGPWVDERAAVVQIAETWRWLHDNQAAISRDPIVVDPSPPDALIEVAFASTAFCLIHRDVLKAIQPPWFMRDGPTINSGGEDRRFFKLAAEAGFPGYVDRSVICGHLPVNSGVGSIDFMTWASVVESVQQATSKETKNGNSTFNRSA